MGIKKADAIVDHTFVRVARLTTSAALFALAHRNKFHAKGSNGLPQFIGGLFYGIMLEKTTGLPQLMLYTLYAILNHTAYNYTLIILSEVKNPF